MRRHRGFTLLELMVVVAIAAMATAGATLALRDGQATQLEREALRLSAMLEAARAQSRTTGVPVVWRTRPEGFEFVGVRNRPDVPTVGTASIWGPRNWLNPVTRAQVTRPAGAQTLVLGPEPLIAAQQLTLQQGDRSLVLATDGLSPFAVATPENAQ
ncbi:prepilin-type N-terminal cleavage/methylation domain-containing protein [Hydrogenophaga sp.]|uniref:prepilin-type N-terminal cleavage/methylation domain-containing protein n=1 Tax=Hydrogenophaga sp. TaxID=1904254 RepID=UPI00271D6BCE|nr:prepilin-type N-terminal cleavage/methylation domain-containing protein [Hydrogenophaga sp.]MDO8905464.1 prepilin-type N-terminal cleavage/methylation domain-containing protein [Hydrogenophaga sp.]